MKKKESALAKKIRTKLPGQRRFKSMHEVFNQIAATLEAQHARIVRK